MSGFLGSSLFPSFNPIQRDSDSESEQEALRNPVTVFSNIQLTETTPTASTTTITTTTQPAPSFPTFSSFSFNALKPSAQQPLSLQTASGTTSPSFNNHATTSPNDPDMSNNYHMTHASSNNKSTSLKRKKNKEKESKKKHKSKHHSNNNNSNNNKDDLEDGNVGPTDRYSAEKTLSGHSKRLLNVQMYYPSGDDAGAVVPSFQSKNNYNNNNTLTEGDLDIFTFDRKGDSENRRYGSANGSGGKGGSKVPRYHSVGNCILGSDPRYRISRGARVGANAIVVYMLGGGVSERLTDRDYRMAFRVPPVQFRSFMDQNAKTLAEKVVDNDEDEKLLEDFIAFPKTKTSAVVRYDSIKNDDDDNNNSNDETSDKESSSFPSSASHHQNVQESPEFIEKTRRLNLRLENNPKNQATWLELIDLQDSLLANATTTNTGTAAASSTSITATRQAKLHKAITEKKLAIYEKALKHFPTSLELLIPYLTLCEIEFGDSNPTRLLTLWDRVLKRTKGESVQLWDRYLTYRQTSYLSFGVNGFVDAVQECMDVLKGLEDSESNQSGLLHIFTRLCNLLHESGYTERAVALYQGQIEFSCFTPPAFEEMDWRQRVDLFEDFWESECPRVGEPGATGWKANVMGAEGVAGYKPFKAGGDEDLIVNDGDDEYKIWFRKEMECSFMNWAPQRSTSVKEEDPDSMKDVGDEDEEDDVDPFATIIFEDIRPFLFNLSSPNLKSQLISNFLNLLSCQFNTTCTSTPLLVVAESLMRVELMNNALVSQFFPKPVGKEVANTTSPAFPSFPLNNFPITVSTLYSNSIAASSNNNPSLLTPAAVASIQDSGNQKLEFIKHVIRQSCKAVDDWDDIGIPLILSMEAASAAGESSKGGGVKAALKLGKSMLKEERMNLSLWAFYAGLEAGRGKLDEARKIFQTALSAYRTFPPENQHDAVLLYVAYTELEMDCQEYCRALWILVSFADSSVDLGKIETERPSATRILKARKFLNEMADAAIQKCNSDYQVTLQQPSSQAIRITSSLITSTCLFEYLHSNNNIEEAFQSISLSLSKLGLLPALRELVLETRLKLYVTHSKRPGVFVRPGDIRTAMELAVSEFPHNTSFLLRFVEYESKTKIENKVRRLFDVELKKNPSSTLWLFAIFTELHHYSGQTYNPHSVRSLFSRAHECPTGKHCPSVWYLSIIFEILQGNVTKAKQLLFRAIRECPWSKKLYMLAMGELRGVFDGSEVAEIIGVMEEKEIRLRCAI